VTYAPDTKLALWVPVAMVEEYVIQVSLASSTGTSVHYLDARATYSRFRQFGVTTRLKVGDK
jgi:hypothetical protein